MYLLAVVFPPLAVLLTGRPFQAVLSVFLTLCLWLPGVIHACAVVGDSAAERRTDRLVRAMRGGSRY